MSDERPGPELLEEERRSLLADYVMTFSTDAGKRVLLDLERQFWVGRTTMVRPTAAAPVDLIESVRNEGQRSTVLYIKAQCAKAQLATPPAQTHAVSSTATKEP